MKGQLLSRRSIFESPFDKREKKRTPVRKSDRKFLLKVQNGRCAKCHKSFSNMRVRPILHHKNLNPKDNRPINMILICPNCHDKIHQKEKKVVRKYTNYLGASEYRVVKISKKHRKSSKRKRKKSKSYNPFEFKIKQPKLDFRF